MVGRKKGAKHMMATQTAWDRERTAGWGWEDGEDVGNCGCGSPALRLRGETG